MGSLRQRARAETRSEVLSFGEWLELFNFNGNTYPAFPMLGISGDKEKAPTTLLGVVQGAYASDGAVFACMLVRMLLFAELRFQWQQLNNGRPGKLFGTKELALLEQPWTNGTTGQLAARAIQDVDLAGNFYVARRGNVLRRLRPDWVTVVYGSKTGHEIDEEVAGYIYEPKTNPGEQDIEPLVLAPGEVAHFAPIPDPLARGRGMSWLMPVMREILGDKAATSHKLKFFENGATPGLVVTFDKEVREEAYDKWIDAIEEEKTGLENAYKTLYLGGGATVTPVGANLKEIEFAITQGHGETRIAAAAGVPPVIVGLSEGLKAATYSNYQQAIRRLSDGTMRPLWRDFCAAMAPLIKPPANGPARLWYDDRDIAFLKEDAKDASEVRKTDAITIQTLINSGYEPDSVVAAVEAGDMSLLRHTGLVSVQLWHPGEGPTGTEGESPKKPGAGDSDKQPEPGGSGE